MERFMASDEARPYLRTLWPIVALIIAIAAFAKAATGKELADIPQAIASLAWPGAALVIAYWFRVEIRALLGRVRKGKGFGIEFELDELREKTAAAEVKAESGRHEDRALSGQATVAEDAEVEEVLREAARSPKLGLMLLASKIERAANDLIGSRHMGSVMRRPRTLRETINRLVAEDLIPSEAEDALFLFYDVRNRIVHGRDAADDEIARAVDSGTRLLRLLLWVPPETSP
jgi:hypothetical protein